MRNLLLLLISFSTTFLSFGQEKTSLLSKLTFKFQTGAGILTPGSFRVRAVNEVLIADPNFTFDTVVQAQSNKGIGRSMRIGGGINYNMNDFLILGLDFETHFKYKDHIRINNLLNEYAYDSTYDEIHYKAFTFSPYITFKALAKPRFFIYNKLGVLFTLPFTLHQTGFSHSSEPTLWPPRPVDSAFSSLSLVNSSYDDRQKIKFQIGFNVAIGLNFRVNNQWRIYGEIFGNFSPLVATSGEFNSTRESTFSTYQQYTDNTVDPPVVYYRPTEVNEHIRITTHTEYQKKGPTRNHQDSLVYPVPGNPRISHEYYSAKTRSTTYNMNVIGLNFGVIWRPRP